MPENGSRSGKPGRRAMATQALSREAIQERVDRLSRLAFKINTDVNEGTLQQISLELGELQDDLRESIQLETSADMVRIIDKLDNDDEILPEDLALIRTWMVSDAEFYVQLENDCDDWIKEISRLFSHIRSLNQGELTIGSMGQISGSIRDALRVIADVVYFRQQEKRVRRFEHATHALSSEDKHHLSRLLRQKLRSSEA